MNCKGGGDLALVTNVMQIGTKKHNAVRQREGGVRAGGLALSLDCLDGIKPQSFVAGY